MHSFWHTIIRPCLELLKPKVVVEIGVDTAQTTEPLLRFAREHGITVHGIDPAPIADMDRLTRDYAPYFIAHRDESLQILPALPAFDCVLVDGDHNWYTVSHELAIIAASAKRHGRLPLVFVHDIAWPYARRDLYYEPARIPAIHRHPWKAAAIDPSTDTLADSGVNPGHAHAVYAHGVRNGVLSAVEDFLNEHTDWAFDRIPGFYGLGILAPRALYERTPTLRSLVERMTNAASILAGHLDALERARIDGILLGEELSMIWQRLEERQGRIADLNGQIDLLRGDIKKTRGNLHRERLESQQIKGERDALRATAADLSAQIDRMRRTLSWRLTVPLRRIDAWLRGRISRDVSFPTVKRLWTALGEPLPGVVRGFRHGVIGRLLPARPSAAAHAPANKEESLPDIAVVIPCHEYGRFLGACIESVLAQTHAASEIVIVDDASSDETARIALSFADRDVRYIRGEWRNVGEARNAGLRATRAPFLVFLDADDVLHPEYLRCGARALRDHPHAGIAYSDHQFFGLRKEYHRTPPTLDWERFDTANHIHAASMVRREALVQAGGWSLLLEQHADWITWRRILRLGWQAVRSAGLLHYRVHGSAMTGKMNKSLSYVEQAGLMTEPATLCLSLSGRRWAWPLTREFLERQTFPHSLIHLIILDTSQDSELAAEVRAWLAQCDYPQVTYRSMRVGVKGLADMPRHHVAAEIGIACATIYNTFGRMVETPLAFILEDDVIPPIDAFPRLIRSFEADVVSVSGLYWHRDKRQPVCWTWDERGAPVFPEPSSGVRPIGGTGFGCLVIRGEFLRRSVFQAGPPFGNYDHNFFAGLTRGTRYRALVDWDCLCRHYQAPDVWF